MSNVTRRNFIQVMAFVGAAMATPKLVKAADLPEPQLVHILPEPTIADPTAPLVWIDGQPLTTGFQFDMRYMVDFPLFRPRSYQDGRYVEPLKKSVEFSLVCGVSEMPKVLGDPRHDKPVEIVLIPSGAASDGYLAKAAYLQSFDARLTDNERFATAQWIATDFVVMPALELMKKIGVTNKFSVWRAAE